MTQDEYAIRLEAAIKNNTPPQRIFYETISSGTTVGNLIFSQIQSHKAVLRLITSPAGRAWVKNNIDGFLNYLATLEKY